MDSLSQVEKDSLEILAGECPYIGGSAVYKARNLYNAIVPMAWSDKYICNAIGVNKNGNTSEEEEIIDLSKLNGLNRLGVKIYPNPASTQLIVDYQLGANQTAELVLYDILGREFLRTILESENNKVTISVLQLPRGIYVSKYVVNGIVESTKKIILD